ncbi:hypothetical protein B484DRAFT_333344, partial [Ochromonadaceae sp. CCMP2298]
MFRREVDDPYQRLGVRKKATEEEIRNAYRLRANAWHPDKHGRDSDERDHYTEMFKLLNNANELVLD